MFTTSSSSEPIKPSASLPQITHRNWLYLQILIKISSYLASRSLSKSTLILYLIAFLVYNTSTISGTFDSWRNLDPKVFQKFSNRFFFSKTYSSVRFDNTKPFYHFGKFYKISKLLYMIRLCNEINDLISFPRSHFSSVFRPSCADRKSRGRRGYSRWASIKVSYPVPANAKTSTRTIYLSNINTSSKAFLKIFRGSICSKTHIWMLSGWYLLAEIPKHKIWEKNRRSCTLLQGVQSLLSHGRGWHPNIIGPDKFT